MYGSTMPRSFGFTPIAVAGLYPLSNFGVFWYLAAATLPTIIVLIAGYLLIGHELTEAEAMVVED